MIFIFGAKYLYLIVVFAVFAWFFRQPKPRRKEILMLIVICLPLAFIASEIAGRIYYNPRPFVSGNFAPLIAHQANNGFPSHHTLLVSALSAIIFLFNRRLGFVLWVFTLFIGFSRVYVGVHHMVDILGSILISLGVVNLIYKGRFS